MSEAYRFFWVAAKNTLNRIEKLMQDASIHHADGDGDDGVTVDRQGDRIVIQGRDENNNTATLTFHRRDTMAWQGTMTFYDAATGREKSLDVNEGNRLLGSALRAVVATSKNDGNVETEGHREASMRAKTEPRNTRGEFTHRESSHREPSHRESSHRQPRASNGEYERYRSGAHGTATANSTSSY
jgi:hypothetical protein